MIGSLGAILRWSLRLAIVAVFLASLSLNVAIATLAPVANAASAIAQRLLGHSAVDAMVDRRTSRLRAENSDIEARNRRLQDDLAREGRRTARLKSDVDGLSRRISQRVFRSTARGVGSTALEAVPIAGGLAAVALTALEVRDSCAVIDDMNALRRAVGVEPLADDWFSSTCARLPGGTADAVEAMTVPECRVHAEQAEAAMLADETTLLDDAPPEVRDEAARVRAEIDRICDCFTLNPGSGDACVSELGQAH